MQTMHVVDVDQVYVCPRRHLENVNIMSVVLSTKERGIVGAIPPSTGCRMCREIHTVFAI
jgi:hypothetical protein